MKGLIEHRQKSRTNDIGELADIGIRYLQEGEYALAYLCLDQSRKSDLCTLYNKALCCYRIEWFTACYNLLCEAERQLTAVPSTYIGDLPEAFVRWEHEKNTIFSPMPYGTPSSVATVQLLKLKAATAIKLNLCSEAQSIHYGLGNKYRYINELLKDIKP